MTKRVAIYPGTFDPITFGHMNIIERASGIFDNLIVGVAADTTKHCIFSLEERAEIVKQEIESRNIQAWVVPFHGLLTEFAERNGIGVIIRGLRALSDFEYEFQMAYMNYKMNPNIETIFLAATESSHFISSRFVREIARLEGDLSGLVSDKVAQRLHTYYRKAQERKDNALY
jgi:pantetheine-phosphate adenylyltransferase